MSLEPALRFKLDENLGARGARLLREAGFDVETVASQDLSSSSDEALIEVCRAESRSIAISPTRCDFGLAAMPGSSYFDSRRR